MSFSFIEFTIDAAEPGQALAEIVLNRPDNLNSFHRPMAAEFLQALSRVADDRSVRALLITGKGRGFCAGQDLAAVIGPDGKVEADIGAIVADCYNPIVRGLRTLPKPVVAAVNGVAAGAGANLALACDLVIASSNASFVQAFSKIGLIPDTGGTFLLPRLVGFGRAAGLMMLGDKLSASEALAAGMIYRVTEPDRLLDESRKIARQLAAMPTHALALTKRLLNASATNTLDAQLEQECQLQVEAAQSRDFQEGVAAFLAKRPAKFEGR